MSQIANITVFDGAATPVSHTFTAVSVVRKDNTIVAQWRENVTNVPVSACPTITMQWIALKSGVNLASCRVAVPVMESISGQNAAGYTAAPKVAYSNEIELRGFFHPRSDVAGRRLARQMMVNLAGNVSTSVAAATSGFLPELFDTLVAPT